VFDTRKIEEYILCANFNIHAQYTSLMKNFSGFANWLMKREDQNRALADLLTFFGKPGINQVIKAWRINTEKYK